MSNGTPPEASRARSIRSAHHDHQPPESMTEAAFEYFRELTNIASFIVFLLSLVDRVDETARIAAEALLVDETDPDERGRLERAIEQFPRARRRLQSFDPMLWQMLYARTIDNYLSYLSSLLSQVFLKQPGTLMAKDTESISYILQFSDRGELVSALAEKRVARLMYMSLEELHEELRQKRLFRLFSSSTEKKRICGYGLLRNLIVHNRGRVSRRYRDRIGDQSLALGSSVNIGGLRVLDDADVLSRNVKRLDSEVAAKFGLDRPRSRPDVYGSLDAASTAQATTGRGDDDRDGAKPKRLRSPKLGDR